MPHTRSAPFLGAALAVLALVACASSPAEPTYQDAFAYCAAVGDVDAPDSRYAGPEIPAAVVRAMGLRPYAPEAYRLVWRCMGGRIYACSPREGISCREKADVAPTPTEQTLAYCARHRSQAFVPATETGRATVYAWKCEDGKPAVAGVFDEPDARGFLGSMWTEVPAE